MSRLISLAAYAGGVLFLAAPTGSVALAQAPPLGSVDGRGPIHQLRIYEIFDGNKQAFHERFRDHALRIMARHRFTITATWETRHGERAEFVYLLEWPDEAAMKARWAEFMADKEWAEIKKATGAKHGALVGEIEDRVLRPTEYSPRRSLLR